MLKTPNIPSLKKLQEEVEKEAAVKKAPDMEATPENIRKLWAEYTQQVESQFTKSTLSNAEVDYEDTVIKATVGSTSAKNMILQEGGMIPFIKGKCGLSVLTINVIIDKSKQQEIEMPKEKKRLTPKEKYMKLREINPLIEELGKRFGLTVDKS